MEKQIGYLIKRVQQELRLRMDAELQQVNLTTAQYAALNALEETPNLSNAALARACFITPQTMIEIIQGLQQLGFIVRQSHPEHGRIIQTKLTTLGSEKVASAHKIVAKMEEKMLLGLTSSEQKILANYLEKCRINLKEN
jgi:DNA-binding MarR family transcriptional regulator